MALSSYTLIAQARRLLRELGVIYAEGTAASSTSTTIVDTINMSFLNDNDLNGYQVVIITAGGTEAVGTVRTITGSTTSTKTITFPTITGLTGTPVYVVIKPGFVTYQQALDSIRASVETVLHSHVPLKYNAELRVNDITHGEGAVERWTAGTAVAPDGFVTSGAGAAVAQETSIVDGLHDGGDFTSLYSAKLTAALNTETELIWRPSSRYYTDYQGGTFDVKGAVYATTASRVRVRLYDGVTSSASSYKDATARYSKLDKTNIAISANATDFFGSMIIDSGASIAAYLDNFRIISYDSIYEYIIPSTFVAISEVWQEASNAWVTRGSDMRFVYRFPDHHWDVMKGVTNNRIRFRIGAKLVPDSRLLLIGNAYPTVPSAATDNIDINPEYVLAFAKSQIYRMNKDHTTADRWEGVARTLRAELSTGLLPNSKVIEPL